MTGRFVAAVLASLVGVLGAASPRTVAAQQSVPVPDFTIDSKSAWLMVGDDFLPPPGGRPGPITFDKRYPYVDNAAARRTGTLGRQCRGTSRHREFRTQNGPQNAQ